MVTISFFLMEFQVKQMEHIISTLTSKYSTEYYLKQVTLILDLLEI